MARSSGIARRRKNRTRLSKIWIKIHATRPSPRINVPTILRWSCSPNHLQSTPLRNYHQRQSSMLVPRPTVLPKSNLQFCANKKTFFTKNSAFQEKGPSEAIIMIPPPKPPTIHSIMPLTSAPIINVGDVTHRPSLALTISKRPPTIWQQPPSSLVMEQNIPINRV